MNGTSEVTEPADPTLCNAQVGRGGPLADICRELLQPATPFVSSAHGSLRIFEANTVSYRGLVVASGWHAANWLLNEFVRPLAGASVE